MACNHVHVQGIKQFIRKQLLSNVTSVKIVIIVKTNYVWQIADEMTQTQGKVEATKDTVKGLNEKLEPVEVHVYIQSICFFAFYDGFGLLHNSLFFAYLYTKGAYLKCRFWSLL